MQQTYVLPAESPTSMMSPGRSFPWFERSSTQKRPPFSPEYHKAAATQCVPFFVLLPECGSGQVSRTVVTALHSNRLSSSTFARKVNHTRTRFNGAIVRAMGRKKVATIRPVGVGCTDDSLRQSVAAQLARSLYLVYLPSVKKPPPGVPMAHHTTPTHPPTHPPPPPHTP